MRKFALGLFGGVLIAGSAAAASSAAEVSVRIEGQSQTLLARTTATLPSSVPKPDGVNECAANSAGAALWVATSGGWSGIHYSFGWFIDSFVGETHTYPDPQSWELWVNGRSSSSGACDTTVQQGDEVLMIVARCDGYDVDYNCTSPPVLPLSLEAPKMATLGAPLSVTVRKVARDGSKSPVQGAQVSAGGASATTAADGSASLTLTQRGVVTISAAQAGAVRDAQTVCVTDGADGYCGTTPAPGVVPPPPEIAGETAVCQTNGRDGRCGTKDTTQPWSHLTSPKHGQRFVRTKLSRTLSGTIEPDGSGIAKVELRLTQKVGGKCATYSDSRERFVAMRRCGAARGQWFAIGDRERWTYLLPSAFARGRYVLDVRVTDKAGNVTKLARTYTRSVFTVV